MPGVGGPVGGCRSLFSGLSEDEYYNWPFMEWLLEKNSCSFFFRPLVKGCKFGVVMCILLS